MSDSRSWDATTLLTPEEPALADEWDAQQSSALAVGAQVDEFEIVRVLGVGGFGIVYLALDRVLLRYVAVKEYLPTSLAERHVGTVSARSASQAETFNLGLEAFFNEARMLASFDHPSLVKVFRFWKANGTAYMAMQYYPGRTLKDVREVMSSPPDEPWLRALLDPLLGALGVLHREDVYHRDISPDNILLLPDGRPVLLDFGSARRVIGDSTQALTAILKPNFSPIEQYANDDGMKQGAWTDLYALGATLEFSLTGRIPKPAVMRAIRDDAPCLSSADFCNVSAEFLATVDWMQSLAPEDRPQSVASLQLALDGEFVPPSRVLAESNRSDRTGAIESAAIDDGSSIDIASQPVPKPVAASPSTREGADPRAASLPAERVIDRHPRKVRRIWISFAVSAFIVCGGLLTLRRTPAPVTSPANTQTEVARTDEVLPAPPRHTETTNSTPVVPYATTHVATDSVQSSPQNQNAVRHDKLTESPPAKPITKISSSAGSVTSAAREPAPNPRPTTAIAAVPEPRRTRPKDACATSNFLMRSACIRRECQDPLWSNETLCIDMQARDEAERQRQRGNY